MSNEPLPFKITPPANVGKRFMQRVMKMLYGAKVSKSKLNMAPAALRTYRRARLVNRAAVRASKRGRATSKHLGGGARPVPETRAFVQPETRQ